MLWCQICEKAPKIYALAQTLKLNLDKKLDPKQQTIQTFIVDD